MLNQTGRIYEFGPFRLDPAEKILWRDGHPVPLTPKAFDTLLILVERGGRLVEKDELIRRLWPDSFVEENSLSQNIYLLRKALEKDRQGIRYIETVPRRGYRFIAQTLIERAGAEELAGELKNMPESSKSLAGSEQPAYHPLQVLAENAPFISSLFSCCWRSRLVPTSFPRKMRSLKRRRN
jgi:DNA-binding winged helix-turn-helix (wHTH) protein